MQDMKRLLFSLLAVCALTSAAQDTEKAVTLDEVTVKGARTIQTLNPVFNHGDMVKYL
jgi:hypothetical protein